MDSFPKFNLIERRVNDGRTVLVGTVSSTRFGEDTWIADRYLGFLKHGDILFHGRWRVDGQRWQFAVETPQNSERIPETNTFQILDGYWGERAELVLNSNIAWQPEQWQATDDHDHCAICWTAISSIENQAHFAATTGERVCITCYDAYVLTRALTFIPAAAQQIVGRERRERVSQLGSSDDT